MTQAVLFKAKMELKNHRGISGSVKFFTCIKQKQVTNALTGEQWKRA